MAPLEEAKGGKGPLASQVAKALAEGVGAGAPQGAPGETQSELSSLLQQQNEELQKQLFVSQQQYKVLATLPPFGGSFATGGMVPGPVGAARLAVVHGGETVHPVGASSDVHLHFAPGTEWLRDFVRVEVEHQGRRAGRAFYTPLPSRGGGHLL